MRFLYNLYNLSPSSPIKNASYLWQKCKNLKILKRTGYTLVDFVPMTNLDEINIYESLIFGSPSISIFKFAVSSTIT